jgi:hypothetical protein
MGSAVARQPEEPSYTETTVVLVIVFVTPLWDRSYPIAAPARPATARKRGGIQSEGQDTG